MKKTHERNALVWLATRPRLMFTLLAILLGLVVILAGCGGGGLTSPDSVSNKDYIESVTQCYGKYQGFDKPVAIKYSNEVRWGPCGSGKGKGPNGECVLAGWSWPIQNANATPIVTYYEPWVINDCDNCAVPTTLKQLNDVASHEVCHAVGNWSEADANACGAEAVANAGCK